MANDKKATEFWKKRAKKYDSLDWANRDSYLKTFVKHGRFKKSDLVLDVGTGTGIVAHAVSPLAGEVVGLDISQDMLDHSNWRGNLYFIKRDIRKSIFCDGVFDKVTARMVFHHIIDGTQKAMNECYRVLKKGGVMILSEGVPPSEEVKKDYIEIFKLKEERLTFMDGDLYRLMAKAGFKKIDVHTVILNGMSVRNWLENSGLPKTVQQKIYLLHKNAGDYFKEAYEMIELDADLLINMKMLILTGVK